MPCAHSRAKCERNGADTPTLQRMQQSEVCQGVIGFTQWAFNLPSAYILLLFAYVSVSAREFRVPRTWVRANVRACV